MLFKWLRKGQNANIIIIFCFGAGTILSSLALFDMKKNGRRNYFDDSMFLQEINCCSRLTYKGDDFFVSRSHEVVEVIHDKRKMAKIKEELEKRNERERLKDKEY